MSASPFVAVASVVGTTRTPRPRENVASPLAEPLLKAADAARLLNVRPSWVYEAVRDGRLPHLKLGRHVRFLRADLETWVTEQRINPRVRSSR